MTKIMVISGPSGCGKSTLIKKFLSEFKEVSFSTSYTTRPQREDEIEGQDYNFISKTVFEKMKDNNEFVEWAIVHGNLYGTSWQDIENKVKLKQTIIMDIDIQGAKNVRQKFIDAPFILIAPPTLEILEERLLKREKSEGSAVSKEIKTRLRIARDELRHYQIYDYIIFNDHLDEAYQILKSIYVAFLNSRMMNTQRILTVLGEKP